jgi:hypothetical protein
MHRHTIVVTYSNRPAAASYFGRLRVRGFTTRGVNAAFSALRAQSRLNPVTAHTTSKISAFTVLDPER